MILASFFWFSTLTNLIILIVYAIALYIISKTPVSSFVMSFLGIASMVYIVQDFNVGPSSDLKAYEQNIGIFPAAMWMYIWLGIVVVITTVNLLHMLKNYKSE